MSTYAAWWPALCIGAGLLLIGTWLVRPRTSLLEQRLTGILTGDRGPGSRRNARALLDSVASGLGRVLGGADHVRSRLERAGLAPDVQMFRTSQAVWGMTGFAAACFVLLMGGSSSQSGPVGATALILLATGLGVVLRDQVLTQQATRREARMLTEFPSVADMLALAVAAGQGPLGALEHVTRLCSGPLSDELRRALDETRAGTPLARSLTGVARRTNVMAVNRFIEGVIVALERGTPLADVLRAQAQDAREAARGELIESAGRKEVLMMAPVVFLVLPITILFAVYPGIAALDLNL